jgi:hypothetical protein
MTSDANAALVDLDADSILRDAPLDSPNELPGENDFRPALRRLADALRSEARLTASGAAAARRSLIGQLAIRASARELVARRPEIPGLPIRGPLFITGLFRTGTTFLQNLMAEHPGVRAPRLWELLAPAAEDRDSAVRAARDYVSEYYAAAPDFRAIHPLDALAPEECHRLAGGSFLADIYALRYRVPGYAAWLSEQSRLPAYEYHRLLLRCLLRQDTGQHVAMKCPSHLWHLDTLADVYPEARVVRLHRAPAECIPSICSLTSAVRSARSDDVDKNEIGRYWLDHAGRALDGMTGPAPLMTLDIRYADLTADPVRTVRRICEFAGIPWNGPAEQRISSFLESQSRHRSEKHHYTAEDFGLDSEELDRRFTRYRKAFGL